MSEHTVDPVEGATGEPPVDPADEPAAATAGEVAHDDPDAFRGGEADAPRNPDDPIDDGADEGDGS